MEWKRLATETPHPAGMLVFSALGFASVMGWLPEDLTARELGEAAGFGMGVIAGLFTLFSYRRIRAEPRLAGDQHAAAPTKVDEDLTPVDGLHHDAP